MIEEQLGFGFPKLPRRLRPRHEVRYIADRFPELRPASRKEPPSVYTAVIAQRARGRSCYRVGNGHHMLAGEIVTTARLVRSSVER